MPTVTSELLQHRFDMPDRPQRIVSLVSAATETIEVLGHTDSIMGMSAYCPRYVDSTAPIVGEYVRADLDAIRELEPDVVLITSGIQTPLGRRLASQELPVYALPLPSSIHGALENILTVAALIGDAGSGRRLVRSLEQRLADLPDKPGVPTYVEVWFGKHLRTIGGRSFITDVVELAGGAGLFSGSPQGYLKPDFAAVAQLRPDVMVALSEPEYPVDFAKAIEDRGWDPSLRLIVSTVTKGKNIIHDGPSIVDTIEWLSKKDEWNEAA